MDRTLSFRFASEADRYWHDKVAHPHRCHVCGPVTLMLLICLAALL